VSAEPAPGQDGVTGLECSVGVMAHNEEANIAHAIGSILRQEMTGGKRIAEVIVVASGCEDRTVEIAAGIASREPRVRLIEQERREGKASAINLFIEAASSPVLAVTGADLMIEDGAFEALLRHFDDPSVGMVGGRPVPVNGTGTFLGHVVHLQWHLHDRIARESPKLGELIVFRNVVPSIPLDTAVDELSLQALITQLGYRLIYEPRAVIYNRGPGTVADFLRQRRRIYAGHLRTREQQAYTASTMSTWRVGRALLSSESFTTPQTALWSVGAVGLEAAARVLGHYDVTSGRRSHAVWEMVGTTKSHIHTGAGTQAQYNVLVFHISNFKLLELQIGLHASRQLARRVADRIQQALGGVTVSVQEAGTAVAVLPGERAVAERAAGAVVELFEVSPVTSGARGTGTPVTLTCGIIALPQSGQSRPAAISAPRIELDHAVALDPAAALDPATR
jgi:GGDEF domain-containing protein